MSPRFGAAIDIGSNSVHLLVVAASKGRNLTLVDESVQLGLGSIVDRDGRLGDTARALTVTTLAQYVTRARAIGCEHIALLGTEPLRRAADSAALQADIAEAMALPLIILSHEAEAQLTLLGVTRGRPPRQPLLIADIGGGSTEIIVARPDGAPVVAALAIGSSRMTTALVEHDPPTWFEINGLRAEAGRLLATLPDAGPRRGVVVGGTGTNVVRLLALPAGGPLDAALLDRALFLISATPAATMAVRHPMTERRVRQLAAGVALLEAVLSRYALPRIAVSEAGLREGAILAAARAGDAWPEQLAHLAAAGPVA